MSRKLATIRRISSVAPIEGADRIEVYTVDGWEVIGQKGSHNVGDLVIYLEIDSWVPTSIAPFLSRDKEPRLFNEVKGEKLKTIRLKGQLSQGLLLPISLLDRWDSEENTQYHGHQEFNVDDDVTELLGVQLYEAPASSQLGGNAKPGGFPSYIPKSDQERIQNLTNRLNNWMQDKTSWEVTEKLDGSSMTIFRRDEEVGVCSRNVNLEYDINNSFWKMANKYDIIPKLVDMNLNVAIQGELIGSKINGNIYKMENIDFYVYNIWDIDKQIWVSPLERVNICKLLQLKHVPIIETMYIIQEGTTISNLLEAAEGMSCINTSTPREGLVFKGRITTNSFKSISNKYLLNQ